jgi:hypothetical protein
VEEQIDLRQAKTAAARFFFSETRHRPSWNLALQYLFDTQKYAEVVERASAKFAIVENPQLFGKGDTRFLRERAVWVLAYHNFRQAKFQQVIEAAQTWTQSKRRRGNQPASDQELSIRLRMNNIHGLALLHASGPDEAACLVQTNQKLIEGLSLAQWEILKSEAAQVYQLLAVYESEVEGGDLQAALAYAQEALRLFDLLQDGIYCQKARSLIASIHYQMALPVKSLPEQHEYRRQLALSLEISEKILEKISTSEDHFTIAAEFANIVKTLYELNLCQKAYEYIERGIRYCKDHDQLVPLQTLLLNAVDIDAKAKNVTAMRSRLEYIHRLFPLLRQAPDDLAIYVGWAKVYYLEAAAQTGLVHKAQKELEAQKYHQLARQLAENSGDQQDKEIIAELNHWLRYDLGIETGI